MLSTVLTALPTYRQPAGDVVAGLATEARRGLIEEEARARLQRHGRNELTSEKPLPAWWKFLAQFRDVLVILLLVATVISAGLWAYERESALPYEAMAILAVVLLSAVMRYIQQSRAERAVAALRQMSAAAVVLPLLATHLLWINLVSDGAPALALGMDPADPGVMSEPPRTRGKASSPAGCGRASSSSERSSPPGPCSCWMRAYPVA